MAAKAYEELKLSEPRSSDRLPPLETYVKQKREMDLKKQKANDHNPGYDDLFGGEEQSKEAVVDVNEPIEIDERNS